MGVSIKEELWTVSIQPAITVRAVAPGEDYDIKPQEGGIWFHSDKGSKRFLAMGHPKLPTRKEIKKLDIEKFVKWFNKSEPR